MRDRVRCLFYIPLGFGGVMTRNLERLCRADASPEGGPIVLADECSPWRTELYFHYTTCPKCAKKYGHNYVVLFTEVAD